MSSHVGMRMAREPIRRPARTRCSTIASGVALARSKKYRRRTIRRLRRRAAGIRVDRVDRDPRRPRLRKMPRVLWGARRARGDAVRTRTGVLLSMPSKALTGA